jgi:molecular chaperone GrpE (heat shock protein)
MLNSIIFIILKLRDVPDVLPSLQNLMEEESIIVDELTSFASNIIKGVCVVLKSFLSFLKRILRNLKPIRCFL